MSKTVVVDANIVLKWVLNEDDSSNAIALLAEWKRERTIVLAPSLLIYEAKYNQATFWALEPLTDRMFCGHWLKRSKHALDSLLLTIHSTSH